MSKRFNFDPIRSVAEWQRQQRILHFSKNEKAVTTPTPSTEQTPAQLAHRMRNRFDGRYRQGHYRLRGRRMSKTFYDGH
jgi:hypothetical protein